MHEESRTNFATSASVDRPTLSRNVMLFPLTRISAVSNIAVLRLDTGPFQSGRIGESLSAPGSVKGRKSLAFPSLVCE